MKLEIACFNLESALIACDAGAGRIELCEGLEYGGITPSNELISEARRKIHIPIYVMIRPRGGNFLYTYDEFEEMKQSISFCKSAGIDGVVFGILDDNHNVDVKRNKVLVQHARQNESFGLAFPLKCTFHRAFDETPDIFKALEEVIDCGFNSILTSGGKQNAMEGINELDKLVKLAGNRITIMPGGGVRSINIKLLKDKTEAAWYHSSAITDETGIADKNEIIALKTIIQ